MNGVHGNEFGGPAAFQQGSGNGQYVQVNYYGAAGAAPPAPLDEYLPPDGCSPPPEPWVALAERSHAWEHVEQGYEAEPLRRQAGEVARRLAAARDEAAALLSDDPWHDDALAARIAGRTDWLLKNVWSDAGLAVSPAEAALLSLLPLLHHTRLVRRAVAHLPVDPLDLSPQPSPGAERARYERFLHRNDRLVRRARALDGGGREIGWWLFHRWLAHDQVLAQGPWPADLLSVTGPACEIPGILDAKSLESLLTAPDTSPHELCGIDGPPHLEPPRWVTPDRGQEQPLREQLVGVTFTVAQRLAIDMTELSPTIVQHLGIAHPVSLAGLRDTVEKAEWERRANGKERRLHARCHHNAVMAALREHAARLDSLLRAVHRAGGHGSWPPELRDLPVYAGADAVVQVDKQGNELPPREAVRFRFDENAVQELLVGEQLYRDPSLAVRELYQNALDACRYRRARVRATAQRDGLPADACRYDGEITFRQGEDEDGRPFLSCTDNGVGMGEEELTGVFSEAGARFVDQPKYLAEKAKWATLAEPVTLHPNSRFGIGVLSYFMLADEIEVTTCRMPGEEETGGRRLRVRITGPGEFFQVDECEAARGAGGPGTTVKLFLREDKRDRSTVDTLRKLLGVAEFRTTVWREGEDEPEEVWEPGQLTPRENYGDGLTAYGELVPWEGEGGQVFWCEWGGGLLVDGLLVSLPGRDGPLGTLRGAVVNLTGGEDVVLSVDRTKVLNDVVPRTQRLLKPAAGELAGAGAGLPHHGWICDVSESSGWIGDVVTRATVEAHLPLPVTDEDAGEAVLGCCLWDVDLLQKAGRLNSPFKKGHHPSGSVSDNVPDHLLLWRILAHGQSDSMSALAAVVPEAAAAGEVLPAVPMDSQLLGDGSLLRQSSGEGGFEPGWFLEMARRLGVPTRELVKRAVELGFTGLVPERYPDTAEPDPVDLTLLAQGARSNWLGVGHPVPLMHLCLVGQKLGITPVEARERLIAYGFTVPELTEPPAVLSLQDMLMLSRDLDGQFPWLLYRSSPVGPAHLAACALRLGVSVTELCDRFTALGLAVERAGLPEHPKESDRDLLARLRGDSHFHPGLRVLPGQLIQLAAVADEGCSALAARLSDLGFEVPAPPAGPPAECDVKLLSKDLDGSAPWLDPRIDVAPGHLLAAVWELREDLWMLGERLSEWGFFVPGDGPVDSERSDLVLISEDLDGEASWLSWPDPVPLFHLLRAAHTLQWPLPRVAARLRALGHTVPDLAETIRAALARVPMA
ncbi:wHTH domain-containing protein [Streptomyces hiroshimensis]|uniref:ATP-binding protein n=1 Tax=Streptomyces hiroshimensis TaxID=66424 RepID=A0ABQ2YA51_9ACTN|nr:hypothetical protein [Streptomyces hiroshimensis]GGX77172.1 hypothetical protein GCM10010324_23330 [Streptomyces hiroshimensis]